MKHYTAYYASPVGQLKIQCAANSVQAVAFMNEEAAAANDEHPLLVTALGQLDEYFTGQRREFSFPVQQPGTDFQQKIWQLLLQIPFGKTLSYQQLSKQYGDVKAIRAVAAANGKNNLAIIVPCHRVIGSNQSLTGYVGGLWRKRWLLEHEAKHFAGVRELAFETK